MTTALPEDQRLINLSSKAYEHPADRAATAALQSIPMLDVVVRKLIEFGYERALRQQFLAASVRLGEDQLPQVWADWNAVCARLDLPERYDLYLTQFPITNAAAIGAGKPMVVINSRCIDLLDELEIRTVLGHEAGHILSDHVLYRTALMILIQLTGATRLPMFAGLPLMAVQLALLEWFRAAELSVRPRGDARQPRPARHLPHADGAGRRRLVAQARPRRVHPPGRRVRGVELGLGQAQPAAHRALPHAQLPGPARQGDHGLGALGRVRPDRRAASTRRATSRPTRARRPATRSSSTRSASARSSTSSAASAAQERVADAAGKVGDWLKTNRRRERPGVGAPWGPPTPTATPTRTRRRRTPTAAGSASRSALILAFMAVEVVAGLLADSLALLSDAAHMLTDAGSIGLALVAARLAARPPAGGFTFGLGRAEILSAQVNGASLLVLAGVIAWEAVRRLGDPPEVDGLVVLVVGLAGAGVNVAAAWALSRAERRSLNVEGARAHVLADLYASLGAALAGPARADGRAASAPTSSSRCWSPR